MDDFIDVNIKLPNDVQTVIIKFMRDGIERRVKGFFYMNGTHPTFASLGSEINNVIAWKPFQS